MSFYRDIFTGELVERPASEGGRQIIARTSVPEGAVQTVTGRSPWWKDRVCRPISIAPEHATPARIAQENESAQKHGTGVWYDKSGVAHVPTRRSRAREFARLGRQDNDAGYGDCAGR